MPSAAFAVSAPPVRPEPFLVVNPHSANGATGRRWTQMEAEARRAFGDIACAFTTGPLDATRLTREALEAGYRTICAVGGDGTINEVLNGFFNDDGSLVSPDAVMAVIPSGTGGDFRRTINISPNWSKAVAQVAGASVRRVDVGRVRYRAHDGSTGTRYFMNESSIGITGAVDAEVNRSPKWMGGRLTFAVGTVRALVGHKGYRVRISVDGAPFFERSIDCVAMCNGQYFGGGMWPAPTAKIDDGLLSCTMWSGFTAKDFLLSPRGMYTLQHIERPGTTTFEARHVVIESDERVLLDVDGEQPGRLPATFEILPGVLQLRA
jgi:YegS/Rv2252/BmrU family lipid kinase